MRLTDISLQWNQYALKMGLFLLTIIIWSTRKLTGQFLTGNKYELAGLFIFWSEHNKIPCKSKCPAEFTISPGWSSAPNKTILQDICCVGEIQMKDMPFRYDLKADTKRIMKSYSLRSKIIYTFLWSEGVKIIGYQYKFFT